MIFMGVSNQADKSKSVNSSLHTLLRTKKLTRLPTSCLKKITQTSSLSRNKRRTFFIHSMMQVKARLIRETATY